MRGNIRIKNIYYMLSYAYRTLRETGFDNVAAESFDNIHDLFAAIIILGVGRQVKRGLHRDYIPKEEILPGVRGRIRVSDSIKQQTLFHRKLACAYDDFSENTLHNQALKSTMLMLLQHGHVKPENKKALRKLLLYFGDVTKVAPTAIRWDALRFHRHNSSYRMLVGICRLAIKGLLLTTEAGSLRLATWLQDEEMHLLYERFVLSYYQTHHPNYAPRAAYIEWNLWDDADIAFLPSMKTDITLTNGGKQLVIDTKYYGQTMQTNSRFESATLISSNIYQIYTYVKNSDKGATGNVAGVLLYAKTDEEITPDHSFNFGGNIISLRTIDLNREWNLITEQLDKLCTWLDIDGCA